MSVLQNQQQLELKKYEICTEILKNAGNELYLGMRFLDAAISALAFLPDGNTENWGCDGSVFHFRAEFLLGLYRISPVWINRGYLHQIMHCLFGHIWKGDGRNRADWDLACDLAAEYLVDSLPLRSVRSAPSAWRREWYRRLESEMQAVTAERIYRILEPMNPSDPEYRRLMEEFRRDDHQFWYQPPENSRQQQRQKDADGNGGIFEGSFR